MVWFAALERVCRLVSFLRPILNRVLPKLCSQLEAKTHVPDQWELGQTPR